MARKLVKLMLDAEDRRLLEHIVAARKLNRSDTMRVLIREEYQRIIATQRPHAVNG